jgi:hypothetical protein
MGRTAEEETIVGLSATTTTPRDALRWTRSRLKIYGACPERVPAVKETGREGMRC